MNHSKIIKPSYKEVEEFLEEIQTLQYSFKPDEKYDSTIQNKVIQLKNLPINSLTDCQTFAEKFKEVALLMHRDIPIWWHGLGSRELTYAELLIIALIATGITMVII
jgi:hypothetical protein